MQEEISKMISHSLTRLESEGIAIKAVTPQVAMQKSRVHGDYTCNIALIAAKQALLKPQELAHKIVANLPQQERFDKVEVAGPGFINFYLKESQANEFIRQVIQSGESNYPQAQPIQSPKKILIEYVSANPTGPLHVGHGRGAAYGESLAQLLSQAGHRVEREYYVNDSGRQVDILALSVWWRYLELGGKLSEEFEYPEKLYQGDYVFDIGAELRNKYGERFDTVDPSQLQQILDSVPANINVANCDDEALNEARVDSLIACMQTSLGEQHCKLIRETSVAAILEDIRRDLGDFGIHYQHWTSEREIVQAGKVEKMLAQLDQCGSVYQRKGALWFRSRDYGDDKDRVVQRKNGQHTYFATDIAYHLDKYERGYDLMINIWGSDHHGYVPRLKAAIKALGLDPNRLVVILFQFAHLYRGEKKIPMSTRLGLFVSLRKLLKEVGHDAARFFYVLQKPNQHMKFDLELAKSKSMDNPVYYVQYAHARIHSVFKQLKEKGGAFDLDSNAETVNTVNLDLLDEEEERALVQHLRSYSHTLEQASKQHNPQLLVNYLRELAAKFHYYYSQHVVLVEDEALRNARLALLLATRLLIAHGLKLVGVTALQEM